MKVSEGSHGTEVLSVRLKSTRETNDVRMHTIDHMTTKNYIEVICIIRHLHIQL